MQHFDAWRLTRLMHWIEHTRREAIRYEIDNGKRDAPVTDEFKKQWVEIILEDARELTDKAELTSTHGRVSKSGGLTLNLEDVTYQDLDHELKVLRECVQIDLSGKFIYVIENRKQEYATKEFFLKRWGRVGYYFPSAGKDVLRALRAYSYGLDTSCVFHLMRVTEIGLRALARRMRITVPKKQLAWAEWQQIITEMQKKAEAIAIHKRAGKVKDEMLEFYRGAIGEFLGFKDAYRNFVMHMRDKADYDEYEARSLVDRVAHFMDRLAKKIDENGRVLTPRVIKRIDDKMDAELAAAEKEKQKANEEAKQGIRELQQSDAADSAGTTQPS